MSGPVTVYSKPFPPLKHDLLLRAARGEKTERVPVWVMRQAGRYLPEYRVAKGNKKFFETCRDPELVSELTIQPINRFPLDAAIIFSDILVIPIALGMKVANDPGEGPVFAEPIQKAEDVDKLNPDFDILAELGYVYEAITLTRHKLDGRVPLFGFSGAPFTLLRFMIENVSAGPNVGRARRFLVECPESSIRLLNILKDAIVRHLVEQIIAGAQIVQVFDSYAGELGPGLFFRYELPMLKAIAYEVREKLAERKTDAVPMVIFAKDAHFAIEELSKSGYEVVGLDWTIQPLHARRVAGSKVTLQGNMDPVMMFASKDEIRKGVKEMLEKFGTQRYIANLGHGILKDTNPDHLAEFINAVHTYSEDMNAVS
ncbi:uroporphyrinogen decarboxylase-like isoform X1 [Pomacea canaliculata]|uniref:uroporphyrinogen decarboxylase-like isoform X1 n=1 Tax=Pomacea canaliculata TaxID=400727 RepID=UPI000D73E971|nr:uroporphyrinogen decarboxylase-like isoform X1 [Pomacea canaliculata]